jgi:hypothetical protein
MSVDMAVWEGDRPADDAAGQVFEALYDRYIDREYPTEPTAKIREFVETLTARFPDLDALGDEEVDDSPWADSPLLAWELALATAAQPDLVAFDPQSGRLA